MESELLNSILNEVWKFLVDVYHSGFFAVFKFFAAIYTLVLFVDLILLLILRGLKSDIRVGLKGAGFPVQKGKVTKKWAVIMNRLESGDASQYKLSILEADKMLDDVLTKIGYSGENMTQRLEGVTEAQIENISALREAHKIRNKIIQDNSFDVDIDETKRVLGIYEDYLKEVELF